MSPFLILLIHTIHILPLPPPIPVFFIYPSFYLAFISAFALPFLLSSIPFLLKSPSLELFSFPSYLIVFITFLHFLPCGFSPSLFRFSIYPLNQSFHLSLYPFPPFFPYLIPTHFIVLLPLPSYLHSSLPCFPCFPVAILVPDNKLHLVSTLTARCRTPDTAYPHAGPVNIATQQLPQVWIQGALRYRHLPSAVQPSRDDLAKCFRQQQQRYYQMPPPSLKTVLPYVWTVITGNLTKCFYRFKQLCSYSYYFLILFFFIYNALKRCLDSPCDPFFSFPPLCWSYLLLFYCFLFSCVVMVKKPCYPTQPTLLTYWYRLI